MASGLQSTGSIVVAHGPSLVVCGMWHLPRSGIKLVSPAVAGRFFTTEPAREPWSYRSIPVPKADFLPEIVCFTVGQ